MPRSPHVPDELVGTAFLARDVLDRRVLTRRQLRSTAWVRLLRGVYAHAPHAAEPLVRWEALRLVLRGDEIVCGRTAAWAHGVWLPRPGALVPLELSRFRHSPGYPHQNLYRRRLALRSPSTWQVDLGDRSGSDGDVVEVEGVRVTSPMRTCLDLMRERGLVESVVVADAFAHAAVVHLPLLHLYCADRRRWPGIRQARDAADLASAGAMSPGESRLRMVVVLGGYPEPLVNVPVLARDGGHLGTPDLQIPGRRPARLEYDGRYHEDPDQQAADLRRENRLVVAAGVPLLRYDRRHVTAWREVVLREVGAVTGYRPVTELDRRDFRYPPLARAW